MIAKIDFGTVSEVDAWAMKWLGDRGYKVATPGEWTPLGVFLKQVDLTYEGFARIKNRQGCPDFERREGASGRLIDIKATDALRRFCATHKASKS